MRYLAVVVVILFAVGIFMGQGQNAGNTVDVFVPLSLSGGDLATIGALSARTLSTSYADTTKSISVQGYERVFLTINETVSDTANLHVYAMGSLDGINYSTAVVADGEKGGVGWVFVDSVNWKPATNNQLFRASMALPDKMMGFKTVRFKIHCPGTVPLGVTTTGTTYPKVSYTVVRKFRR
jgi:hypothetical protein